MKNKKNTQWVQNSVALLDRGTELTEEGDLRITATLKVFRRANGNQEIAEATAYDEFITTYYGSGGYQLPLCYQHDTQHIIGAVTKIERDEERLTVEAVVFHTAPDYHYICDLVMRGVLGGVSDGSYVEGYVDDDGNYHVTSAQMCEVSLVTVPAEILAGVSVQNTRVYGFDSHKEERQDIAALMDDRMFNTNFN